MRRAFDKRLAYARACAIGTTLACAAGAACAQEAVPLKDHIPDPQEFIYYYSLLYTAKAAPLPTAPVAGVVTPAAQKMDNSVLSNEAKKLALDIQGNRESIFALLQAPIRSETSPNVELEDGDANLANAVDQKTILISARTVQAFMLGGLDELRVGDTPSAQAAKQYIWGDGAADLAKAARATETLFSAMINGKYFPLPSTTTDAAAAVAKNHPEAGDLDLQAAHAAKVADLLAHGGEVDAYDAAVVTASYNTVVGTFRPAQNFMLRHELGHVELGDMPTFGTYNAKVSKGGQLTSAECQDVIERELRADRFAIYSQVYGAEGDSELIMERMLGADTARDMILTDPQRALSYGYRHLLSYGFAEAHMNGVIGKGCSYPSGPERIKLADTARIKAMNLRREAINRLLAILDSEPPFLATPFTHQPASSYELALWAKLSKACGSGADPRLIEGKLNNPGTGTLLLSCNRSRPQVDKTLGDAAGNASIKSFLSLYAGGGNNDSINGLGIFTLELASLSVRLQTANPPASE